MLAGLGRFIHRRRWTSLALILLLTTGAGGWGLGVLAKFKQGFAVMNAKAKNCGKVVFEVGR